MSTNIQSANSEMKASSDKYVFKYNGELEYIDINTLILSQMHFGAILSELKDDIAPETNLKIKIKPLEKGSWPFEFYMEMSWLQTFFNQDTIFVVGEIVATLVGLIKLRGFLKGRKPDKVIEKGDDKVEIHIDNRTIVTNKRIYHIYGNNNTVNEAMNKSFEALENDEEIEGIEIQDKDKKQIINVERNEFDDFITPNEILNDEVRTLTETSRNLVIFKLVFDPGYRWQFYKEGRKISAIIKDDAFMKRLDDGEKFAKGDVLVVDLEVEQKVDKTINTYVDSRYTITRVIRHIPRAQQGNMFYE